MAEGLTGSMPHYIALIHKDPESFYGVSFPDVPGVLTAGHTLDEAVAQAAEILAFASEDWKELTGAAFPQPRSLDVLRRDASFSRRHSRAVVAAIPFRGGVRTAA